MPPPGIPAAPVSFFGRSATMASVVIRSPAIDAAFCRRRVDDALGDEVAVLAGLAVEAERVLVLLQDLADDDGAILARVDRDLAGRPGQRLAHDLDAGLLVVVFGADALASQRSRRSRSWARW